MQEQDLPKGFDHWIRYSKAYKEMETAEYELLSQDINRVAIFKQALHSQELHAALHLINSLKPEELQELLPDLIYLASFRDGGILTIREAILKIPKEYLMLNIENFVEPYLTDGTYGNYRRFLELFILIDPGLTEKLAKRAILNEDFDIYEAGVEFLQKIEKEN
jgi:hypothetical protein